jgi:hypothetical protein
MYDFPSPMYPRIPGLNHPTQFMSYTWSIFQASLLSLPVGFCLLFSRFCSLFMLKELVCVNCSLILGCFGHLCSFFGGQWFVMFLDRVAEWVNLGMAKTLMCP